MVERLAAAQDRHDLDGILACFGEDHWSEQRLHPSRTFQGIDQVRKNWFALLEHIPDFRSNVVRSASPGTGE